MQGWYTKDDFMAFGEQSCSSVILGPKIMVEYEVCLLTSALAILDSILVMWCITLVRTEVDALIVQVPLLNALVPVNSANIAIGHMFLKTRFFGLHFCGRPCRSIFNDFDVTGPKATEFGEKNAR